MMAPMQCLQDVNICSALCFGQILRIHAPDTPYSDEDLTTMFRWFTVILRRLEHPSDPNFEICYSVLDNASQVRLPFGALLVFGRYPGGGGGGGGSGHQCKERLSGERYNRETVGSRITTPKLCA